MKLKLIRVVTSRRWIRVLDSPIFFFLFAGPMFFSDLSAYRGTTAAVVINVPVLEPTGTVAMPRPPAPLPLPPFTLSPSLLWSGFRRRLVFFALRAGELGDFNRGRWWWWWRGFSCCTRRVREVSPYRCVRGSFITVRCSAPLFCGTLLCACGATLGRQQQEKGTLGVPA